MPDSHPYHVTTQSETKYFWSASEIILTILIIIFNHQRHHPQCLIWQLYIMIYFLLTSNIPKWHPQVHLSIIYVEMQWFVILFFSKRDVLSFVCLWGQIEGNPNINIDGSSDVNGHKNTRWRESSETPMYIISYFYFFQRR